MVGIPGNHLMSGLKMVTICLFSTLLAEHMDSTVVEVDKMQDFLIDLQYFTLMDSIMTLRQICRSLAVELISKDLNLPNIKCCNLLMKGMTCGY